MFKYCICLMLSLSAQIIYGQDSVEIVSQAELKIGADTCYSRAFGFSNDKVWMAASNGRVYCYSIKKERNLYHTGSFQLEELRDLYVNDSRVIAMMSGSKGRLLEIDDSGARVLDSTIFDSVFLDAFDMNENGFGAMIGDPVNGYFSLYFTRDFGKSWTKINKSVNAGSKEFAYAASGSIIRLTGDSSFVFVTGGLESNFYECQLSKNNELVVKKSKLNFKSQNGSGAFSMSLFRDSIIVVVGGNYLEPDKRDNTCFISDDLGRTWRPSKLMPNGYRSSVVYDSRKGVLYSSGRNGIDYSMDDGMSWYKLTDSPAFSLHLFEDKLFGSTSNGVLKVFKLKVLQN